MAKQLNINLGFSADTTKAKAQIQDLQKQLSNLVNFAGQGKDFKITPEIENATKAAAQLQVQLKNATNVKTGQLDLGKFNESMQKSGMSLKQYQQQLSNLGSTGDKVFASLAQSITNAEIPLKRSNALMDEMWTTMKNTARWQLSSSILHAFVGALEAAYGYAKDLNESLTNIRIVTGQTSDQMAAFAERANQAAQQLSTTTTQYTDASLIFYQQGLSDEEVKKRTDATIKMANVTGDSVEQVSSYMTAIWNNFDDGSESLEHYEDVITALGAATASSSSEISEGLEKFASIGKTIGLSYDYATSALATIVGTTRQSADQVGTSLRTIFSRLQSLSQGEETEDGVTLNKYSKALANVGVQIFDTSGQLKDMDTILDDLADKWDGLSRAQQVALAQTVGGVRQYTTLIALMNNWDLMQKNLTTAKNADGTVDQQAEIYAESWEAARKRVKAAVEDIYNSLIDDKFFIKLNNLFSDFLKVLDDTIDRLGGLKGVLLVIGTTVTQVFQQQISESLGNLAYSLMMVTKQGRQKLIDLKMEANKRIVNAAIDRDTTAATAQSEAYKAQGQAQIAYLQNVEKMSKEERQIAQILLDRNKTMSDSVVKSSEELENAEDLTAELARQAELRKGVKVGTASELKTAGRQVGNLTNVDSQLAGGIEDLLTNPNDDKIKASLTERLNDIEAGYNSIGVSMEEALGDKGGEIFAKMQEELQSTSGDVTNLENLWSQWNKLMTGDDPDGTVSKLNQLVDSLKLTKEEAKDFEEKIIQAGQAEADLAGKTENLNKQKQGFISFFGSAKKEATPMSKALTQSASTIMAFGSIISTITGIINTWGNSEKSVGERTASLAMSVGMLVPSLVSLVKGFQDAAASVTIFGHAINLSLWQITAIMAAITALVVAIAAIHDAVYKNSLEGKLEAAQKNAKELSNALSEAQSKAQDLQSTFDDYQTVLDKLNSCTKGTQEWTDALEEANKKTTEILEKYPELLSQSNLFDENGLLNPDVLQDAIDKANNQVNVASAANIEAQAKVQQAQFDIDKKNFAKDYYENTSDESREDQANSDLQQLLDTYQRIGDQTLELSDAYDVLGIDMDKATDSQQKYAESLLKLAQQSISASNSLDNATQGIINSWANTNGIDLKEGQSALMSNAYQDIYDTVEKAVKTASDQNSKIDNIDDSKITNTGTDYDNMSVTEAFNKARGTNYDLAKNGVRGTKNNRSYVFLEDGEEKEHTLEEMQATIAAAAALDKMGAAANNATDALNSLDKNVEKGIGDGLKGWLSSNNFESMNEADFNKMSSQLEQDNEGNYTKKSVQQYLEDAFDTDDLDSLLGKGWYDKFNTAALNFNSALDSVTDGLSKNAEKIYNQINDIDQFSIKDQSSLAQAVQNAFEATGSAGAQALVDKINNAFANGATVDEVSAFAQTLSSIDWKTESIADFKNALASAGVDAEALGINVQEIFDLMSKNGDALSSLQEQYKNLQSILADLKTGDTINDKDYQALSDQIGAEAMDGFFSTMADGTHMLVGDAQEFYNAVMQGTQEAMLDNISKSANLSSSLGETDVNSINEIDSDKLGDSGTQDAAAAAEAYLETLDLTEEETAKLAEVQNEYNETNEYGYAALSRLHDLMQDHVMTEEQYNDLITQNNETLRENSEALLSTANSLAELDGLTDLVSEATGEEREDVDGYSEALIKLASQYDNCAEEIEAYQEALDSGNEATIKAAESSLRAAEQVGELSEKYDLDAEEVEDYSNHLADSYDLDKEAAVDLAVANTRLDRGIGNLVDNLEDYQKALAESNEGSAEWSRTLGDLKNDLADVLNVADGSMLSDSFAQDVLASDDLQAALDGDSDAILRLRLAAADDIIVNLDVDDSDLATVQSDWDWIKNYIETTDINAPGVDQTQLINTFNEMIKAGNMTKEQIEAALSGLNVSANLSVDYNKVTHEVPFQHSWTYVDGYLNVEEPYGEPDDKGHFKTTTRRIPSFATKTEDAGLWKATEYVPTYKIEGTTGPGRVTTAFTKLPAPTVSAGSTKSGRSSGSGGGGGSPKKSGGSPKKTKTEKEKKYNSADKKKQVDEIERYHVIKNQIEDLTAQYERISKAKDRAFGTARISALNREIAAQKRLNAANKEYLSEIEGHLASDRATMAGYGASFDSNGTITNYESLVQQQVAAYNAAVDAYNKTYTDDEGAKKAFDAAKDRYSQFKNDLKQYEEAQDLYNKQLQETIDGANAVRDLMLELTKLKVTLKIDVAKEQLDFLEQLFDNIENKAYDVAEAFSYLDGMTEQYFATVKAYRSGLQDLFANQGISASEFDSFVNGSQTMLNKLSGMLSNGENDGFTQEDVENIRDYRDGILEANENLQKLRQTVHDQILTVWDDWNDKLDDSMDAMEHLQEITESYANIIDLVGQRNLGVSNAFMGRLRQQGIDQANDRLAAEKSRYEALKAARDDAYAKFEQQKERGILSPEEIKSWEDSLREMDKDVRSASEDFQSSWEDALDTINKAFEEKVQEVVDAYSDAAAGLEASLSDLSDAFDRGTDLSTEYLADYEKIYQFNKLNRDIENSIDETDNVKAKQDLLDLQAKINDLDESGVKISEYEIEQLRQEYELRKARYEMEEAQSAKSQVQIQRDSEGNYAYVYTANQDDVAAAEQTYADKLHDMQVANADYIQELQENIIKMEQDYQDKVQEIMTDTSITAEERMAKLDEVSKYYNEKMDFYMSEVQLWEQNSQELYDKDWKNYSDATGYKISAEDEWLDHWNETQLSLITGFENIEDFHANHNANVANLLDESSITFQEWQMNVQNIMEEAGTTMEDFQNTATSELGQVAESSDELKWSIRDMASEAQQAMQGVTSAVITWENQYSQTIMSMISSNNRLVKSFNQLIAAWSGVTAAAAEADAREAASNTNTNANANAAGSNGRGSGKTLSDEDIEGIAGNIWVYGTWGDNPTRHRLFKEKFGDAEGDRVYNAVQSKLNSGYGYTLGTLQHGWDYYKKYAVSSYDTGGYTGTWGTDGRLAMLHEKELVLNKDDTKNFLDAINVIRDISDMIDLNVLSSSGGLSSMLATAVSDSTQSLQQEVTIHAEFPNATDKDQISEAFSDLINLASQYANRQS